MKSVKVIAISAVLSFLVGCGNRYSIPKHGNWNHLTEKPYIDRGNLYVPQLHYNYDEVGYASWYGERFHRSKTALGDCFDMNGLTAAHRFLPLPSVVRVTNLENGRSVILVVNDRGPFVRTTGKRKRIIDISKRAAAILGVADQGVIKVRVTCLKAASIRLAQQKGRKPYCTPAEIYYVNKITKQRGTHYSSAKPRQKHNRSIDNFIKKLTYAKNILLK